MHKKILIIDDDTELCQEIAEFLSGEGNEVDMAFDGMDGCVRLNENKYDIVILDYKMSGLDGIDVLKFVKENNIKCKVILSSGRPFIEKQLADNNLTGFVTRILGKPLNSAILIETINSL